MALGEDLKDMIRFGAAIGNALGKSLEDGKFNLSDIINFIDPATKIPAAFAGIENVPSELKAADPTELQEFVKTEFDIPDDKAEEFVEDTVQVGTTIAKYVLKHFTNVQKN